MNLHLLRMFATVVEQQGFSRAAEALHVSQSAVSKAVRELEHQLDAALVDRSGGARGLRLTEAGQALYEHARGIFALERAAVDDLRQRAGLHRGRLRIAASTTVAGYWLPPLLAAFLRQWPHIDCALDVGNTGEVAQALIDTRADVGFVEGTVEDPRIQATVWRHEPLQAVAAADSALAAQRRPSLKALQAQAWLIREPGSGTRQVALQLLRERGIVPQRTVEIGSNEAIARAVAAGAGVALLPAAAVQDLLAMGRLRALKLGADAGLLRPLYRLELAGRPRSPALRALLALPQAALG